MEMVEFNKGGNLVNKITLGPKVSLYPLPAVLVGANIDKKPNFMTAAWCGIVNSEPPMLSVSVRPSRYTHQGIIQNMTLSINVASAEQAREVDYCGIISGAKVNKVEKCRFKIFYGKLKTAPLIEQCPVNLECKVVHILELNSHTLFVCQIEEVHISENCLTDGKPDPKKVNPIVFTSEPRQYHSVGDAVAEAYSTGLDLDKSRK